MSLFCRPDFNGKCICPRIHVYTFSNAADPVLDVINRASAVLKCPVELFGSPPFLEPSTRVRDSKLTTVHHVRDVAPKKLMLCLSFTLPLEVSLRDDTSSEFTPSVLSQTSGHSHTGKRASDEGVTPDATEVKKIKI